MARVGKLAQCAGVNIERKRGRALGEEENKTKGQDSLHARRRGGGGGDPGRGENEKEQEQEQEHEQDGSHRPVVICYDLRKQRAGAACVKLSLAQRTMAPHYCSSSSGQQRRPGLLETVCPEPVLPELGAVGGRLALTASGHSPRSSSSPAVGGFGLYVQLESHDQT